MRPLLLAFAASIVAYVILAISAPKVFEVLVYDESKLMPPDIEPEVVNRIIANVNKGEATVPVVIFGPRVEEKARELTRLYPNTTTPWSILDKALDIYYRKVGEAVDNATAKFREAALEIARFTNATCGDLERLADAYRKAREEARRLLLATYGVAAYGKAVDNATAQFLQLYEEFVKAYDVDTAVRFAADKAYGNVSNLLANVTWKNWATDNAVDSVAVAILSARLNKTLIDTARAVSVLGVGQYLYVALLNSTPAILRPYLPLLVCGGDVEKAVDTFRNALWRNITSYNPPPTLYSLPLASELVYRDQYAIALVKTSGGTPAIPVDIGVPVSTSQLLKSFQEVVTQDVSLIDKTTAAALFLVLLTVLGTILTPLIIVSTVGLTYLALLGFIFHIHDVQPIYYLTVYMAAPVVFAIGVDYMLLMTGRYAEERAQGNDKLSAVSTVRKYANRAIAASAAVVATSLGSFAVSPLPFMQSIGIGYLMTTAFVVVSVFVIFPSLLLILGDKIFWPRKTISVHEGRSKFLEVAVSTALRRPLLTTVVAVLVTLLSFAFLITTLKVTANPVVAMPETPYKKALEVATTYFPNVTALSTTYIAMQKPPPGGLLAEIEKLPHLVNYTVEQRGEWYVVSIKLSVEDTSDELLQIYHKLDELRRVYGPFLIGGAASWKNVIFSEIYIRFWNLQVYIIIALAFLILSFLLRSFLIPARLLATVLMSISWSLALEVLIFQVAMGKLTYWLVPVILFAFLIAIGTDYDIFIVARIREELERGLGERDAIKRAIVATGPIVTGAAMILAAAFSTLLLSQTLVLRQVGFTIALAALIDAFIIRPLVVPAMMVLAGRYNWLWFGGYSINTYKQSADPEGADSRRP